MLQLSSRPLRATSVDAALFVDRERELETLERALDLRLHSLLLGERGSGRTSLLHQLQARLEQAGVTVRFVDGGAAETPDELGAAVGLDAEPPTETVVLLDGVRAPDVVHELFGRRRDELWELPLRFVVSGEGAQRARYLAPPADAFFDVVVELGELSPADAAELFRRRAAAPGTEGDATAHALLAIADALAAGVSPRTPRHLLAAARAALVGGDPAGAVDALAAARARAAALGRPAALMFADLVANGPASASDEALLDRLGWTRARAVQVLKQLEGAGLVRAEAEARAGQGRPRKLYAAAG